MFRNDLMLDFCTNPRGEKWFMGEMHIDRYKGKSLQGGGGGCCQDRHDLKKAFFAYLRSFLNHKKAHKYTHFVITIRDRDHGLEWTINGMKEVGRFRQIYRQLSQRQGWSPHERLDVQPSKNRRK